MSKIYPNTQKSELNPKQPPVAFPAPPRCVWLLSLTPLRQPLPQFTLFCYEFLRFLALLRLF
jgi:hypothetical protein